MIEPMEAPSPQKPRLIFISSLALAVVAVVFLIYVGFRKFNHDRESAMNFQPHAVRTRVEQIPGKPITRTYTQKEIEDARKQGKKLPGMPNSNLPNTTGDDAVQRS